MIKKWLMFGLVVGVFASCSQEGNEPNSTAELGGETVSFSLSAEVSVDDPSLRAIDYQLGNNANGELVPMPQFVDKQEVEVHTILKNSNGVRVARTLTWRYDATKKKLVLKQNDGHNIWVSGFNNDNSTKWYISGLIGGVLNGTKVEFMGTRVVKGVSGNAGDALGSMEVPYAFGWTELTINTSSSKDNIGSHKYAEVPKNNEVKFKPLGSMLAVKLGTNQSAGPYAFTPKGFTLVSNAWGDQGYFELSTDIPSTDSHKALPRWTEGFCAGSMYYTFANGEEPGTIAHNQTTAKTYYVWVMPHKTVPTGVADVRVMLKGTSSRPETEAYKDYTNTWFTDYTTEGKATQGKVTSGKVHPLTAKASRRVGIPIDYVTEYNLAGGEGLTYTTTNVTNPQPTGVTGPLRFASSHGNDQSGYYNWYKVVGRYNVTYNPDIRSLQTEVDNTFGADRYYIATYDQWLGILSQADWSTTNGSSHDMDYVRVGLGPDEFKQFYSSEYSKGFSSDNETRDATIYAIRFKANVDSRCRLEMHWEHDPVTGMRRVHTYRSASDNSMKCAYRFRRVGGRLAWDQYNNQNLTNQLIVDVVYLGEESTPTEMATISDEVWWSRKQADGQVISRIFPSSGKISSSDFASGYLSYRGAHSRFWSSSQYGTPSAWSAEASQSWFSGATFNAISHGFSVRLFTHPR